MIFLNMVINVELYCHHLIQAFALSIFFINFLLLKFLFSISLKQKKYPVIFLSLGKTNRYMQYKDPISNLSQLGCNLSICYNFLV